jgi:hypothetical protein
LQTTLGSGLPFAIALALPRLGQPVLRREVYFRFAATLGLFLVMAGALMVPSWAKALLVSIQ